MLANFQWYRRLRGGRWAKVTGWIWGKRWVRVPAACVERVDEDYDHSPDGTPPPWPPGRIPFPDEPGFRDMVERDYRRWLAGGPMCTHGKRMDERCPECQQVIRGREPGRTRFA